MLVHEYLTTSAHRDGAKSAVTCGPNSVTYGSLARSVAGLSAALSEGGFEPGDRVLICLPNSIETVTTIFATSSAGGVFVATDPTTPMARLSLLGQHSGARVIVGSVARVAELEELATATGARLLIVGEQADEHRSFTAACAHDPDEVPITRSDTDAAAIIYTSGSTGEPKGVTLSHRNFDAVTESVGSYLRHSADDVVLSVLQLAFGYGLLQLLVTIRFGGRLVLRTAVGYPYDFVRTLVDERVTGFAGVPTLFAVLLGLRGDHQEDFSALRYITNVGAALPPSFAPRLMAMFPQTSIYLMHGQTECLRTSYLPPEELERRPTSVGRGMPNVELWVEHESGRRAEPGEVGELMVRGPNLMIGYWNDPETTRSAIRTSADGDRVLRTRDLFRQDEDGFFYFVSRTDDIIKCRGEKVSPNEVEAQLFDHPAVREVRVIGVPDEVLGSSIRAEVVTEPDEETTERHLKAFLRGRLEDYKLPQTIVFVDELPKSPNGKVLRR